MIYEPHNYQTYATRFIESHEISALLLDMGLGKSVITLTAIKHLIGEGKASKVLIIAPLRVAKCTWPSEIRKWDHLKEITYSLVVGTLKERIDALKEESDVYLVNRENVEWLIEKSGFDFDYDMVVIDELSSFKSYKAKRFKTLLNVRYRIKRMVGLTGSPTSNGLMDLFAEYRILDGGKRLGRYITRYREAYFLPDKRNASVIFSYKLMPGADKEIYGKIADITISMKSRDHLKMPDIVYNDVIVPLSEKERGIYDSLKRDMVVRLANDGEIDAVNAGVLSNKLLQMANGAVYDENKNVQKIHDGKLDALEDLLEQANGKPVLIAYWFKHDLSRIKERFEVREMLSPKDIDDWNNGGIRVGVIHPLSAGHGLNLQEGGATLIWFGLTWSLETYEQTNARLFRQGQKEMVVIHHIITEDTIDEDVIKALKSKAYTQDSLINAVKARLEV